ncbi:Multidrug-efflux transporter quinolene resistance protein NorA [Enhygromyxa salina]|uniref:Multidrug-efflux transporter quinolene resistance protein NorA n=1 Tax=Enhygromyxa salina TaxID=215803 RepID=A0A0C2D0L9_9BACT|nr:Multidrug-efflux transporter quinolene resistance protein NorA [Enhygromyxa salina]
MILWVSVCLNMVGFGLILPVLPFHAERFGASPAVVTMLAASFSVAQLFAAPVLGRLGDRIGRRPILLISIAGACASMTMLALADGLGLLFAARLLSGSSAANAPTAQAYVAACVRPSERARALGRIGAATGVGFVLGPALGGLLSTPAWPSLPFVVAAILAGINFIVAFVWLPEAPRTAAPARPSPAGPRSASLTGWVLMVFGIVAAFAAMESTFALLVEQRHGWGPGETGMVFALVGVVIVLSQAVIVGRVAAWLGDLAAMRLVLGLLAAGLACIGLAPGWLGATVGACLVALGNGLSSPTLHAMISRRSTPSRRGADFGLVSSAGSLGRILGPLAAGLVFESLGPGAPSLLGAGVVLALASVTFAMRDS